jgi:oligoendopeptidase F
MTKKITQLETEISEKVNHLDQRMLDLEDKIDLITTNHLSHIQTYLKWILGGGSIILLIQIWLITRLM